MTCNVNMHGGCKTLELCICTIRLVKILELIQRYSNRRDCRVNSLIFMVRRRRRRRKKKQTRRRRRRRSNSGPCSGRMLAQFGRKPQISLFIRTDAFRHFPTGGPCQPVQSPRLNFTMHRIDYLQDDSALLAKIKLLLCQTFISLKGLFISENIGK